MHDNFYCWETDNLKEIFNTAYPEGTDFSFSFSELLDRFVPPLEKTPEMETQLKLPENLFFQRLRESGVETHDDIDFCFSEVSVHERFLKLKNNFHQYLEELSKWDLTSRLIQFQENIFNTSFTDFEKPIIFVKSLDTRASFQKVEQAFKRQGAQTNLLEPWQLPSPRNSKTKIWTSSGVQSLKELIDYAQNLSSRAPNLKPMYFWGGSEKEKRFFDLLLKSSHQDTPRLFEFEPLALPTPWIGFFFLGEDFFEKTDFGGFSKEEVRFLLRKSALDPLSGNQRRVAFFQSELPALRFRYFTHQGEFPKARPYPFTLKETKKMPQIPAKQIPVTPLASYFSATQLDQYAKCPKQYAFRYVHKLKEQKVTTALALGKTLHGALERVFKANSPQSLDSEIQKEFEKQFQSLALSPFETQSYLLQLETMVEFFNLQEKELKVLFPQFVPRYFEQSIEFSMEEVFFKAMIDRIDCDDRGNYLILDYKTGNVDFSPSQIEDGKNFQALIYLMGAKAWAETKGGALQNCIGILFYDFKKKEVRRGLLQAQWVSKEVSKSVTRGHTVSAERWNEIVDRGKTQVAALLGKIKNQEFQPKPSREACGYCDFNHLCEASFENVD